MCLVRALFVLELLNSELLVAEFWSVLRTKNQYKVMGSAVLGESFLFFWFTSTPRIVLSAAAKKKENHPSGGAHTEHERAHCNET